MNFAKLNNMRKHLQFIFKLRLNTHDEELEVFAQKAYVLCVEWFGVPQDADKKYKIVYAARSFNMRVKKGYLIGIYDGYMRREDCFLTLSHEMYHRVAYLLPGLRKFVWVDEMMAFLTSVHIMQAEGYAAFAEKTLTSWRIQKQSKTTRSLQSEYYSSRKNLEMYRRPGFRDDPDGEYPEGFIENANNLGIRLETLVGWEAMCRILHCQTWEEWIQPFSKDVRAEVRRLLELE
jgi:hypothetical protein